jgi:hypothetical protein
MADVKKVLPGGNTLNKSQEDQDLYDSDDVENPYSKGNDDPGNDDSLLYDQDDIENPNSIENVDNPAVARTPLNVSDRFQPSESELNVNSVKNIQSADDVLQAPNSSLSSLLVDPTSKISVQDFLKGNVSQKPLTNPDKNNNYYTEEQPEHHNLVFGGLSKEVLKGLTRFNTDLDLNTVPKDASYFEGAVAGIVSGAIKFGEGFVYVPAEILDYFASKGVLVNEDYLAKAQRALHNLPVFKQIVETGEYMDAVSRQTFAGELAKGATEIYLGSKLFGALGGDALAAKAGDALANKIVNAAYSGRLITSEASMLEAGTIAETLNKAAGVQKYTSIAVKGLVGGVGSAALVADVEDIGTFGSMYGLPTALDEQPRQFGDEDAQRRIINRLKFAAEGGVLGAVIPIGLVVAGKAVKATGKGTYNVLSKFAEQGQNTIKNDAQLENLAAKNAKEATNLGDTGETINASPQTLYSGTAALGEAAPLIKNIAGKVASTIKPWITSEGDISKNLYEASQSAQGQIRGFDVGGKRLVKNLNQSIKDIDESIQKLYPSDSNTVNNVNSMDFYNRTFEVMRSKINTVENGQLVFKGFSKEPEYIKYLKDLGIQDEQINNVLNNLRDAREAYNSFGNSLLKSSNIKTTAEELDKILAQRELNNYKINYDMFKSDGTRRVINIGPTKGVYKELRDLLEKNAELAGATLQKGDIEIMMSDIIDKSSIDFKTKAPKFNVRTFSGEGSEEVKLGKSIDPETGKFVPNQFIRTLEDLKVFEKVFGKNATDIGASIFNTIHDLGTLVAHDNFYQGVLKQNENLIKTGQKANFYKTQAEAERAFKLDEKGNVIKKVEIVPVRIKSPINDEIYHSVLNDGFYTTKEMNDALSFVQNLPFESLTKSRFYRDVWLPLNSFIAGQKTVMSPTRHILNNIQYSMMFASSGNILKNPVKNFESMRKAFQAVTSKYNKSNLPKGFEMYQFLSEEGISMSHAGFENMTELLSQDGDNIFKKIVNGDIPLISKNVGGKMKNVFEWAKNRYIDGDEFWKFTTFFSERDSLETAYLNAIKNGTKDKFGKVITKMPDDLNMLKEAARITREIMPNYNRVSKIVQVARRFPLLGNFVLWPSESLRNVVGITKQGILEIQDPVLRSIGIRRLASLGTSLTAFGYLGDKVINGMNNVSDDVQAAIRKFVPKFMENSMLGIVPDKEGNYTAIDINHFNPYSFVTAPISSMFAEARSAKFDNPDAPILQGYLPGFFKGIGESMRPFYEFKLPIAGAMDGIIASITNTGIGMNNKRVFDSADTIQEKAEKIVGHILEEALVPGGYQQAMRLQLAAQGKPGDRGEQYKLTNELWGLVGLRKVEIDPKVGIDYKISEYNRTKSEIQANTRSFFGSKDRPIINRTDDEILEEYITQSKKEFEAQKKLKEAYEAAKTLDLSDQEILKKNKASVALLNSIKRGNFSPIKTYGKMTSDYLKEEGELSQKFDGDYFDIGDRSSLNAAIKRLKNDMKRIKLDENFDEAIDPKDYLENPGVLDKLKGGQSINTPPLIQGKDTSPVSAQVIPQTINTGTQNYTKADEAKILNV